MHVLAIAYSAVMAIVTLGEVLASIDMWLSNDRQGALVYGCALIPLTVLLTVMPWIEPAARIFH
jgi:hypothetical protein